MSTPLLAQYKEIKQRHRDSILFFRMGDFYEMFYDDAVTASRILEITLTARNKEKGEDVPMCGIPYHSASPYIAKLIKKGFKVAICEQLEDTPSPSPSPQGGEGSKMSPLPAGERVRVRGLVKRDVVRIITPGTTIDPLLLDSRENNFIAAVYPTPLSPPLARGELKGGGQFHRIGLALLDISTGDFLVSGLSGDAEVSGLKDRLMTFRPKEILIPDDGGKYRDLLKITDDNTVLINPYDQWQFSTDRAYKTLVEHFKTQSLEGFGCKRDDAMVNAAGALISYITETQKADLSNITSMKVYSPAEYMLMDNATIRNLELLENIRDGERKGSLLSVIDKTETPMGARMLKQRLIQPLLSAAEIQKRLDAVEVLKEDITLRNKIRSLLKEISDIERITGRISLGTANARDLIGLKDSIIRIPELKETISGISNKMIGEICSELDALSDISDMIAKAIIDSPPHTITEGGIIKDGYNKQLDELRSISREGKGFILNIEKREKERTGIESLKVRYNQVFGYYIEITKANLHLAPEDYIRKQTLTNAERFITSELKEYEEKVLGAEDKICRLELELFNEIREAIKKEIKRIQKTAHAVAGLDVLSCLAETAADYNYTKPQINNDDVIRIIDGRHPVIERGNAGERFVPNDTLLDNEENSLLIITGPNMAGKSTYMRQAALIVLMAQIGSFVPAKEAAIGITDRIFTRIGASDFLTEGQSTFMVEMNEAANILNNATARSLIILDEIGRGTSTFDGISIAWAVAEYIHNRLRAKTLFATHYHELTELALTLKGVKNYSIAVREWNDEIIFLRKILEGSADRSYGIQVARLAGLPIDVIERAKEILSNLENAELNEVGEPKIAHSDITLPPSTSPLTKGGDKGGRVRQIDLFTTQAGPVIAELLGADILNMTPLEALNKLHELKKKLQ
ncbi:MAG: DNA mismatch repair protein MutS [Nitrospirae bacterium]|nr:DNA mismatch repair protein MutS [Nitrospirota bacterium]